MKQWESEGGATLAKKAVLQTMHRGLPLHHLAIKGDGPHEQQTCSRFRSRFCVLCIKHEIRPDVIPFNDTSKDFEVSREHTDCKVPPQFRILGILA